MLLIGLKLNQVEIDRPDFDEVGQAMMLARIDVRAS